MQRKKEILILGLGSEVLKDDSIGPKLVNDISSAIELSNIKYQISPVGGMETIEIMKGFDDVIIIDGVMTRNGVPGTVYMMSYPNYRETIHLSNAHDISFDMSVKLARKLGIRLPENIKIVAIEIVENMEFGEELTEPLQKRYDEILNSILNMIRLDHVDKMPVCYEEI